MNILGALGNINLESVLIGVVLFLAGLYFLDKRYGQTIRAASEIDCCDRLVALEERNTELLSQVQFLVTELRKTGIETHNLSTKVNELMIHKAATAIQDAKVVTSLLKPLLLICSDDLSLCNADRNALRRAGLSFQRVRNATKVLIEQELRRRRQDGTLYPWVHITAHAGPSGIMLADGIANPAWWSERLDGIDIVFLAACQGSMVADAIAGLVSVVFMQEDVDNQDAADFTYCFWSNILEGDTPRLAYEKAVEVVRNVAEFVDFREK